LPIVEPREESEGRGKEEAAGGVKLARKKKTDGVATSHLEQGRNLPSVGNSVYEWHYSI
jgi:hypothetical protein